VSVEGKNILRLPSVDNANLALHLRCKIEIVGDRGHGLAAQPPGFGLLQPAYP
jgi:hypothetical protein